MWLRLVVTERLDIAASIPPSGPTSHSLRPLPVFFKPQVSSNGTKAKTQTTQRQFGAQSRRLRPGEENRQK